MINMPDGKIPNYAEIIQEILTPLNGPIAVDDLASHILQKRPSKAKNPHRAALAAIQEEVGRKLVFLDESHVLPLRLAYQGARYRIRLTKENIDQAALSFNKCFSSYLPPDFNPADISFIDSKGSSIPFQVMKVPHTIALSPDKKVEYQDPALVLKAWFHSQKIYPKDHILVTIVNWDLGSFSSGARAVW